MPRIAVAGLLLVSGLVVTQAAAATIVTLQGAEHGEICRFRAGDVREPFQRWLASQDVTCAASGSSIEWQPGLWNVFARASGAISNEPIVVDAARPPDALTISIVPAAALLVQLPAGANGVLYSPRRVIAYPASGRTLVPAGEEIWLFVLSKSEPAAVIVIPPVEAGGERDVGARSSSGGSDAVGWIRVSKEDRDALSRARGIASPDIRVKSGDTEASAMPLPAPVTLDGSMVVLRGLPPGDAELRLAGRGWLPFKRTIHIDKQQLTLLREPIEARSAATLIVNWSTLGDLAALDRSFGSCEPPAPPRFDLIISSCSPPRPGDATDAVSCQAIRTEPLTLPDNFGTVSAGDVAPGLYRAELRFGKLPPVSVTTRLAPLQQEPIRLQAVFLQIYGSLTRGGQALGEAAGVGFPADGRGFLEKGADEYHAVLTAPFGIDAKIEVATCNGEHVLLLSDRRIRRDQRFDIDIPDNVLEVRVIDTFTRVAIEATLKYSVMSLLTPRTAVIARSLAIKGGADDEERLAIKSVPVREIRLEVSSRGYKPQEIPPFTMPKSGEKDIDVEMVPLGGMQGTIVSSRPFERAMVIWTSGSGAETESERADLNADGTFFFEQEHLRSETMTVVSLSHPLWIVRAPQVERATPLVVHFPDTAPQREAEVSIQGAPDRTATPVGVTIGGLHVPAAAFAQHLALRGIQPLVQGSGPLRIPAMVESGPIEILRGPTIFYTPAMSAIALRGFATVSRLPLLTGSNRVEFGK